MRKVWLPKDSLFRMEGNCQGQIIRCQAGVCWITQEGDLQDHLLEAGERLTIDRAGLVLVQGITDGSDLFGNKSLFTERHLRPGEIPRRSSLKR